MTNPHGVLQGESHLMNIIIIYTKVQTRRCQMHCKRLLYNKQAITLIPVYSPHQSRVTTSVPLWSLLVPLLLLFRCWLVVPKMMNIIWANHRINEARWLKSRTRRRLCNKRGVSVPGNVCTWNIQKSQCRVSTKVNFKFGLNEAMCQVEWIPIQWLVLVVLGKSSPY